MEFVENLELKSIQFHSSSVFKRSKVAYGVSRLRLPFQPYIFVNVRPFFGALGPHIARSSIKFFAIYGSFYKVEK